MTTNSDTRIRNLYEETHANRHHDRFRNHDSLLYRAIRCCAFKALMQVSDGFR